MTFTKYTDDLNTYLMSKLPNIPACTLMEISEYIGHKTVILVNDVIVERDKEWKNVLKEPKRSYRPISKDRNT